MNIEDSAKDSEMKYQVLYDIVFHEYKTEIERSKSIDEKVTKLFTVLNILITIIVALLTRSIYWEYLGEANIILKILNILAMIIMFNFLAKAWFSLFKHLKSRRVKKLEIGLGNDFEDIVYDDSKNVSFLYFKAYKTYQKSILENASISNDSYQALEESWQSIKVGFSLFCIFMFVLFLNLLQGVAV